MHAHPLTLSPYPFLRCAHSSGLKEGWYRLNVEGSLTTDMPSLLSLSGNDTFNDNDTDPNWM